MIKRLLILLLLCTTVFGQWEYPDQKPMLGQQISLGYADTEGLVGYLLMNEGVGNTVQDLSGNRKTGTMSGTVGWAVGEDGPVLDFGGGYVTMEDADWTEDFTEISAIAYHKSDNLVEPTTSVMACKGEALGDIGAWTLVKGTTGRYYFRIESSPVSGAHAYTGLDTGEDKKWHHIAGTWDGKTVRIYFDGTEGTSAAHSGTLRDVPERVSIGAEDGGSGRFEIPGP